MEPGPDLRSFVRKLDGARQDHRKANCAPRTGRETARVHRKGEAAPERQGEGALAGGQRYVRLIPCASALWMTASMRASVR
jgi:hypothetical protein